MRLDQPMSFLQLRRVRSLYVAAVACVIAVVAVVVALVTVLSTKEDERVYSLSLGEGCLAFEAVVPPGFDDDLREELRDNPAAWRFYRTALGNFMWSTDDPLHRIEMARTDDFDPTDTDVWRAMVEYHEVIDAMSSDHLARGRYETSYFTWQEGDRALSAAGQKVEAACLEVGAEIEITEKIGLLYYEEGSIYDGDGQYYDLG